MQEHIVDAHGTTIFIYISPLNLRQSINALAGGINHGGFAPVLPARACTPPLPPSAHRAVALAAAARTQTPLSAEELAEEALLLVLSQLLGQAGKVLRIVRKLLRLVA